MTDRPEHVEPQDHARRNSSKQASKDGAAELESRGETGVCYWNDKKYSDGSTVCDNHRRYECWNAKWVEIGDC